MKDHKYGPQLLRSKVWIREAMEEAVAIRDGPSIERTVRNGAADIAMRLTAVLDELNALVEREKVKEDPPDGIST